MNGKEYQLTTITTSPVGRVCILCEEILVVIVCGKLYMFKKNLQIPTSPLHLHMSKIILVTGGSGLVGSAINAYMKANPEPSETYIFLSSKDGDLRSRADTEAIFEKHKPTKCIHLAAKVGGLFANMKQKVEFYRENIIINDNIMECCRIYKVEKVSEQSEMKCAKWLLLTATSSIIKMAHRFSRRSL